jgi:hypothetical protein
MPPIKIVYATATCAASTTEGFPVRMSEGEPWAGDDPFVKSHPGFFSDVPPAPNFPRRTEIVFEQTSAAPTERRTVKRG